MQTRGSSINRNIVWSEPLVNSVLDVVVDDDDNMKQQRAQQQQQQKQQRVLLLLLLVAHVYYSPLKHNFVFAFMILAWFQST